MTQKKAPWADAYEAGYRVGYKHGLSDASVLQVKDDSRPTPRVRTVDVSGTDKGQSAASRPLPVPRG